MHCGFNGNVQIASLSSLLCSTKQEQRLSIMLPLTRHQTTTDDDFCAINNLGSPLPAVDGREHCSHDFGLLQQTDTSGVSCSLISFNIPHMLTK